MTVQWVLLGLAVSLTMKEKVIGLTRRQYV